MAAIRGWSRPGNLSLTGDATVRRAGVPPEDFARSGGRRYASMGSRASIRSEEAQIMESPRKCQVQEALEDKVGFMQVVNMLP